jgi:hypothetical protein
VTLECVEIVYTALLRIVDALDNVKYDSLPRGSVAKFQQFYFYLNKMECKYDVISDEEDFPEPTVLTRTDSVVNPLIAIQEMVAKPTHRRQRSIRQIPPTPIAIPAGFKPSSKIFYPALEPPRARMSAAPVPPSGGGYTIANAFGVAPPLPCPLSVAALSAPVITTGQINRLNGSPVMTLNPAGTLFNGGQISDLTLVVTSSLDFGLGSALTKFVNVTGTYSLASGVFGVVPGGTYKLVGVGGTGYGAGTVATQYTLHLSSFIGTTGPIVTPPSTATVTFSPDIAQYLPARGTIATFINDTTASATALGTITVEQIAPTAVLSITDSDAVTAWQWTMSTPGQGWFEQGMSWTV